MADPIKRDNLKYEEQLAAVSMAGIRPLVQGSDAVSGTSAGSYTITDIRTKRAVVVYAGSALGDVTFDLNTAADANSFPLVPSVYFVVEVEVGDVVHFYNTTGGSITVHVLEIR